MFGVRQEWGGLCAEQCGRVSGDVAFQFALRFCGTKEYMAFFINSISLKGEPDRSFTALTYERGILPSSFGEHSTILIHEAIASSLGDLHLCIRNAL